MESIVPVIRGKGHSCQQCSGLLSHLCNVSISNSRQSEKKHRLAVEKLYLGGERE